MSSASAGSTQNVSGENNRSEVTGEPCPHCGSNQGYGATSTSSAEAEQGEGPAAASATSSGIGENGGATSAVAASASTEYAAAACDFGVVAVGPNSAAAASEVGVVSVCPTGAAAASNAANGTEVTVSDSESQVAVMENGEVTRTTKEKSTSKNSGKK